jgi:hypothetical protein
MAQMKGRWYIVTYYDGRNSMTYKQPVKADSAKEAVIKLFGSAASRKKNYIKKIKTSLMK